MDGFDRYSSEDNGADATLDDSQALELAYVLRRHHARWLRRANLCGGHRWSKAVLFKVGIVNTACCFSENY